jgi:hypothetical protein
MEVLEKIKLNLGADIAAIFPNRRNTCFASCQKLSEL